MASNPSADVTFDSSKLLEINEFTLLSQIRFDEIFAEPEVEIHSFDRVWRLSKTVSCDVSP